MCVDRENVCTICVQHSLPPYAQVASAMSPEHRLLEPTMCGAQQVSKGVQVKVFHLQLSQGSGEACKSRKAMISVQNRICCFEINQWHSKKHKMKRKKNLPSSLLSSQQGEHLY